MGKSYKVEDTPLRNMLESKPTDKQKEFIGNLSEFTEGLVLIKDTMYYKTTYPYNDSAAGYNLAAPIPEKSGWVKSVVIKNQLLIPSEFEGASNNYFSSYVDIPEDKTLNYVCAMGGSYYQNQSCGHLYMDFRYKPEATSYATGSRIVSC